MLPRNHAIMAIVHLSSSETHDKNTFHLTQKQSRGRRLNLAGTEQVSLPSRSRAQDSHRSTRARHFFFRLWGGQILDGMEKERPVAMLLMCPKVSNLKPQLQ